MTFKYKNQNDILDAFEVEYLYENKPVNRTLTKPKVEGKSEKLKI